MEIGSPKAKPENASALLEISPTALLLGAWHSTGEGGGLGAKFARCLISEIVAIDVPVGFQETKPPSSFLAQVGERITAVEPVTSARRPGSRIDPLGILREVKIYRAAENETDWTPYEDKAAKERSGKPILYPSKNGQPGRPAVINHGNVKPSLSPVGITCDHIEHSFVLSFAALRRLRFGGRERDSAGRSLLAALGLVALTEQDAQGYALRSRCDLVCDGRAPLELVRADGATVEVTIDRKAARALFQSACEAARKAGFALSAEPLRLTPQGKLVEIVRKSQELALAGKGGDENEAGDNQPDS